MNARTSAQEWAPIWSRIVTQWPTLRRFTDRGGWYDDVKYEDASDLTAAMHNLRRSFTGKEPTLAHYLLEVRNTAGTRKRQTDPNRQGRQCGHCEHGWEYDSLEGRTTVRPCRNGCHPATAA